MPTLGVDFSAKNLKTSNDEIIRLHLWDVAGQISFQFSIKKLETINNKICNSNIYYSNGNIIVKPKA